MDVFWVVLIITLINVCTETVITVLLRLVFEKTHPSYLVYHEDGSVSVYIYQIYHPRHEWMDFRYIPHRVVWKKGKWRAAAAVRHNTKVDIIVSCVLLIFVALYLIVMLGAELLVNIHVILVMALMMLLFCAPTLILHHVIVHSVLKRLLRET